MRNIRQDKSTFEDMRDNESVYLDKIKDHAEAALYYIDLAQTLQKMLDEAVDIIIMAYPVRCPTIEWSWPKGWERPHDCHRMDRERTPEDVCRNCVLDCLSRKAIESFEEVSK